MPERRAMSYVGLTFPKPMQKGLPQAIRAALAKEPQSATLTQAQRKLAVSYGQQTVKYHNVPREYRGVRYQSGLEAKTAAELDLRIKAKELTSWERQVKVELHVYGRKVCDYFVDFVAVYPDGHRDWIECKGMILPHWKLKWAIMEAVFDKDIRLHPDDRMVVVK